MREKSIKNTLNLLALGVLIAISGCFTDFGPPSLDGSSVAFHASVEGMHYEAIYMAAEGCLDPVVDTSTNIPGGTGKFVSFGQPGEPSLDGGEVAFWGSGTDQEGIYLLSGQSLSVVADLNTSIPGGTGNFAGLGPDPSLDSGRVAFRGSGPLAQEGIYHHDANAIHVVADANMPFPGGGIGAGNFVGFKDFTSDGDNVVFIGIGPPAAVTMEGIYMRESESLRVVADLNTPIPGGIGNFNSFGGSDISVVVPSADGGSVAFVGEGTGQMGVYLETGGALGVVADLNTAIPGGFGNFTTFSASPSLSGGSVAFRGGGSGGQLGIYLDNGGSLDVVADKNTPIPGGTGNFGNLVGFSLDEGNVAFQGDRDSSNPVRTRGIYLYNGSTIEVVADTQTPVPGRQVNFTSFLLLSADGGNVTFEGSWPNASENGFGIYLYDGNTIHVVADITMPTPPCAKMLFSFFKDLSADGANVAFNASSSGSHCLQSRGGTPNIGNPGPDQGTGIYLNLGGSLSLIADRSTPIPGSPGNLFYHFYGVSADGANVGFRGTDLLLTAGGIYLHDGNAIQIVADRNTPIPGGTGNFETFSGYSVDGDRVVFQGRGPFFPPQEGVYLHDGSELRVIADANTVIPGGTGKFESFSGVSTEGGNVVFAGGDPGNQGVFLDTGGSLSIIADGNTPVPPNGFLLGTFDHVSLDGGDVTFGGGPQFAAISGIYRKTAGGSLTVVADYQTQIPGRSYFLNQFGGTSVAAESVAFHGSSTNSTLLPSQGIYLHDGDAIRVVADTLTSVPSSPCSPTARKRTSAVTGAATRRR